MVVKEEMKSFKNVSVDGTVEYRNKDGKYHREDGPAVEYTNGDKFWYINGKRHREDGPAAEFDEGDKFWFLNGERHREDGPAIEWSNSNDEYFLNGKKLPEAEFLKWQFKNFKTVKLKFQ